MITGSRAEFGLLRWVMQEIKEDPKLDLQIIATGMHLSASFGSTYKEIEEAGFDISLKIESLDDSDSPVGIAKSIGIGVSECAKAFRDLQPDVVVVLGDRFEIFAAATAALVTKIPLAHIHGGESTVGAFDESMRHSITKMSSIHFVAAEDYKKRVIQLGENPEKVYNVGGLGLDGIEKLDLLGKEELQNVLGIRFQSKSLLVTFHPATLENDSAETQMKELLLSLSKLSDTTVIFTLANADMGGRVINSLIDKFIAIHENAFSFASLGQRLYFSCIREVDGVIGNSSSGLTEVPTFKKGTVNIGDRQMGRLQAGSVINCSAIASEISLAIDVLFSEDFKLKIMGTINPYGEGGASERVVKVLREIPLEGLTKKYFYDL